MAYSHLQKIEDFSEMFKIQLSIQILDFDKTDDFLDRP